MSRSAFRKASVLFAGSLLALVVACGDKKPPVAAPPPPPPPPAPVVQPPPPPPPPPPPAPRPTPPPPPLEPTEVEVFNRLPLDALNNGQLVTNLPGPNNDLVFSARNFSLDPITIAYNDPGGQSAQLSVTTTGKNITVNLGRNNGQVTSTAADIAAAIAADPAANALVSVANKAGNNGVGTVTAMPAAALQRPMDDIFFDFDKADLSEAARTALQKDADFLRKWTNVRVTIEGHADSRGTNEYNLALGERRAAATRDYLVSLGIGTDRVSVVSKGEEQPFCSEDAESCWALNRRGHFIITGK